MLPYRLKKNIKIKLVSLNNTNVGINEKIYNYLGKTGIVKNNYKNLKNCSNNVLIMMDDNFSFWVSYKDLEEIEVGIFKTYSEIAKNLKDDSVEIVHKKILNIYKDFSNGILEKDIAKKYNIDINIILEIYFLFKDKQ